MQYSSIVDVEQETVSYNVPYTYTHERCKELRQMETCLVPPPRDLVSFTCTLLILHGNIMTSIKNDVTRKTLKKKISDL
jgi:hypothetical protein